MKKIFLIVIINIVTFSIGAETLIGNKKSSPIDDTFIYMSLDAEYWARVDTDAFTITFMLETNGAGEMYVLKFLGESIDEKELDSFKTIVFKEYARFYGMAFADLVEFLFGIKYGWGGEYTLADSYKETAGNGVVWSVYEAKAKVLKGSRG